MVREEEIGGQVLPHGGRVLLDEVIPLGPAQVLEVAGLHVLVAVEHEDRKRPVERRPDDRGAAEVVLLRIGLLAEDDDLVAEPAPRPRERPRVDVRPRPAQEVAVPDENLHAWKILTHRWSSGRGEATAGRSSSSSSDTRTASSRSRRERSARRTRRPTPSRRPLSGPGSGFRAFAAARSSRRGSTGSASTRPTTSGSSGAPSRSTRCASPPTREDSFHASELSSALQDALNQLDEDYRVAVVLYDVLGRSYTEIAELTEVAEGTVKSRIFRGRSRLAELLGTRTAEE